MWTAEVIGTARTQSTLLVTVRLTRDNPPQTHEVEFEPPSAAPPSNWLQTAIRQTVDRFTALDAVEASITLGPVILPPGRLGGPKK